MFWCAATRCVGRDFLSTCQKTTCLLTTFRTYSTSPCVRASSPASTRGEKNALRQWDVVVDPFCAVRALLGCSIAIKPLDPHAFPEANRAFVALYGSSVDRPDKLEHVNVHYDVNNKELSIRTDLCGDLSVELTTPIKSNLHITTWGEGNVHIQNMECDVCEVLTVKGNCVLRSVKGHRVEVRSSGGHVTGVGTIHGNVDIRTCGDGAVDVQKLQGSVMKVSTEHGPLQAKAVYAESTSVSSSSGRVELGSVHGDAAVKNVSGDVIIDGSNGALNVWSCSGNIDVYVGDGSSADLYSQTAAVCVRVPASIRTGVELIGATVDVSPEVILHEAERSAVQGQTKVTGYVNGKPQTQQRIKAQTEQGRVHLKTQSWFESLKLKGST